MYIYTNLGSNPISHAGPILTQSGILSTSGYHTVHLNSGIQLSEGKKFSVVLKLINSGYNYPCLLYTSMCIRDRHNRDINAAIKIKKFSLIDQNLIGI